MVVTVDRDEMAGGMVYIDGNPDGAFLPTKHTDSLRSDTDLWIGSQSGQVEPFVGRIANLEFFDRALGRDEVAAQYRATSQRLCYRQSNPPPN